MKYLVVAAFLLSIPFATLVQAQTEPAVPLLSVGVRGGVGNLVMSDMNIAINEVNDVLLDQRYDELNTFGSGPMGGGELRIRILPYLALSMTIEYLFESSSVDLEVVGEEFRELEIYCSTVPITARALYVARSSKDPKMVYVLGGGFSYLMLGRLRTQSAETINVHFPSAEYRTADGDGYGFQFFGGAEYFFRPWLSVGGELLYRHSKIGELTYNDNAELVTMSGGEKMTLDFSGFNFLACIRFHL
jgi:hypothetical protein